MPRPAPTPVPATTPAPAPAPAPRPRRPVPAPPLSAQALDAVRSSIADPAVWVFPFLMLAMMPLGLGQLFAGILALVAALAALQPRSNPRHWGQLAAVMLLLTIAAGLTADALIDDPDPFDDPDVIVMPSPPPRIPPPMGDGRVYDIEVLDQAPRLSNPSVVQRSLERAYPPLLRDAGVGGTVLLGFTVVEDGSVDPASVEVLESTNQEFSTAAVDVVKRMRFTPGIVNDRAVRVGVQLPITFQPEIY
jgi:protein TonB